MLKPLPRKQNVYLKDEKSLVAKVPHFNGDTLQFSLGTALELLGGLDKSLRRGDEVWLKPNFNCSHAIPLSTEPGMLAAVIEILLDYGVRVVVGEMSGRADWPTEKVVANLKILPFLKRYRVPFVNFQHEEWVEVEIGGEYWQVIRVPRCMYEAQKRIYLANMRCHSSGRFTCSLKLGVGWISAEDREILHSERDLTEARVAELNLAFQPDLVLVDGRRSVVEWAGRGPYVYPNLIMASGDMVAVDTEAVRTLKTFPAQKSRIQISEKDFAQLSVAQKHGLGSMDYLIVEADAHLQTDETENLDPASQAVRDIP